MKRKSKRRQLHLRRWDMKSSFARSTLTHLQTSLRRRSSPITLITLITPIILGTHHITPNLAVRHRRVSLHLAPVTCHLHAANAATAPAAAAHQKQYSRSARRWLKNRYRPHQRHPRRQSSLRSARRSLRSVHLSHHTLGHLLFKIANIAASAILRPKFVPLSLNAALCAWSVKTRTGWHYVCATGLTRNTNLLSTVIVATERSFLSWRGTPALRGTLSAWKRTEKVGWPWFGLLIDSTSVRWVKPCRIPAFARML